MTENSICSLKEYFGKIESIKVRPSDKDEDVKNWLFRGVTDSEHKLIPSVFHAKDKCKKCACGESDCKNEPLKYDKKTTEFEVLTRFIREAYSYTDTSIPSREYHKWAEIAQHYGVPTRLMDWSSNALTALYFACNDALQGNPGTEGVVWVINYREYNTFAGEKNNVCISPKIKGNGIFANVVALTRSEGFNRTIDKLIETDDVSNSKTEHETDTFSNGFDFKYPMLYPPIYANTRMSAQGSRFMVWGSIKKPLNCLLGDKMQEYIHKIRIPAGKKNCLLRELDGVGISQKTLFPGLEGIAKTIEWRVRDKMQKQMQKD